MRSRDNRSDTNHGSDASMAALPSRLDASLSSYEIPRDRFAAMLAAFGPVPRRGQYRLALRLIGILAAYRIYILSRDTHVTPDQHVERLRQIHAAVRRVLELLGITEPASILTKGIGGRLHPTATMHLLRAMEAVAVARHPPVMAGETRVRLTTAIEVLSVMAEAAHRAEDDLSADVMPGHGGKRRSGAIPQTQMIGGLIDLYAEMRRRYPSSGRQIGFSRGGPLERFIRACFAAMESFDRGLGARVTSRAIEAVYRDRRKPNPMMISGY